MNENKNKNGKPHSRLLFYGSLRQMRKKRKILLERERIVLSKTWHVEWTKERDDCHITFYFENLSQRN